MNYLDTERTRYQNQDRYATSPEASGQETRAFSSRLLVLVSWFFAQPDYQDATPDAERRGILMIKQTAYS
ncbi:MAG TPA: hypothetical protein VGA80_15475 [Flavobacteriaceae bacterium]